MSGGKFGNEKFDINPEFSKSGNSDLLCCDDCGKTKEDVRHTNCPYAEEINNSIVLVNLCGYCYHERCMDI